MSSNQYQREIAQLIKDVGSLRVSIGVEETAAGKARAEAARKRAEAAKTTNVISCASAHRAAESADKKVAASEKKIGDLQTKLGAKLERQRLKNSQFASAMLTEQSAADRLAEHRRRKDKAEALPLSNQIVCAISSSLRTM